MRCVVTGSAGFIGSTLVDRLLRDGHEVIGIDSFTSYYSREVKEANLEAAIGNSRFTLIEQDMVELFHDHAATQKILANTSVVFHQAAQAGVRSSWGTEFEIYSRNNIVATQNLLEAARTFPELRVVYASSSSVYGETRKFPMEEGDLPRPVSPYGVSKLAAEHLACLYSSNFGVHSSSLRYFTVYGPRQRPDMAFHRIITSILTGEKFALFGSGEQSRDFTFVEDIVEANIAAWKNAVTGAVYNIGGGTRISMNDVISLLEKLTGRKANIVREQRQSGDVTDTGADTTRAREELGFTPSVSLEDGLKRQIETIEHALTTNPAHNVSK